MLEKNISDFLTTNSHTIAGNVPCIRAAIAAGTVQGSCLGLLRASLTPFPVLHTGPPFKYIIYQFHIPCFVTF